jgi:hypothetical protein
MNGRLVGLAMVLRRRLEGMEDRLLRGRPGHHQRAKLRADVTAALVAVERLEVEAHRNDNVWRSA